MYKILKLNKIDDIITKVFPKNYEISDKAHKNQDAIILRSYNLHNYDIPENVIAIARAGAGVNNIPVEKMLEKAIPVFNAPGANANAVKELIIGSMINGSRNYLDAVKWANTLSNSADIVKDTETGKKQFVGPELLNKTLGVIGLGYVGGLVANAAVSLNMEVLGYDPFISVDGAWSLSRKVKHVTNLKKLFETSDFITMHVPLNKDTRNLIDAKTIALMKKQPIILNYARDGLVNNNAILKALENKQIKKYITDFPNKMLLNHPDVICTPHLGASTPEAEQQCAIMAAKSLIEYLENGNIINSVNYPNVSAPRTTRSRITILHDNVANMLSQATSYLAEKNINIENIVSSSKKDIAYMIIDTNNKLPKKVLEDLEKKPGFIKVRIFQK